MVFIWIVSAIVMISVLTEFIRRSNFYVSLLVFLAVPAGLTLYWSLAGIETTAFMYAKIYSVSFGSLVISALRFLDLAKFRWARFIAYLVLFINILEAILTEYHDGGRLNVIAGGLLLLTMAHPRFIRVDPSDTGKNLQYELGMGWVLSYVLWNFVFVYGTNPPGEPTGEWAAFALVHLSVPLLLMRGRSEMFIQVRAYSLTLLMFLAVSAPYEPFLFRVPDWHNPLVSLILRAASLALAVYLVLRSILRLKNGKAPENILQSFIRAIQLRFQSSQ